MHSITLRVFSRPGQEIVTGKKEDGTARFPIAVPPHGAALVLMGSARKKSALLRGL